MVVSSDRTEEAIVSHSLKMGLTYTIGFTGLLVSCFLPFPVLAKRMLHSKLNRACNSMQLLLRLLASKFGHAQIRKKFTYVTQSHALAAVIERDIEMAEKLLEDTQRERPFHSLSGYEEFIQLLKKLVMYLKGMMVAMRSFKENSPVCQMRASLSQHVSYLAVESAKGLMDIFEHGTPQQENNKLIKTGLKILNSKWNSSLTDYVRTVYGEEASIKALGSFQRIHLHFQNHSFSLKKNQQISDESDLEEHFFRLERKQTQGRVAQYFHKTFRGISFHFFLPLPGFESLKVF